MLPLLHDQPPRKDKPDYNQWTVNVEQTAQKQLTDVDVSRDIISCAKNLNVSSLMFTLIMIVFWNINQAPTNVSMLYCWD